MRDSADTAGQQGLRRQPMLIGGEWVWAASGETITVENPSRRVPIAEVPRGGAADVDRAVAAALSAFATWRKLPARERGRLMMRIADDMESRHEELARTIAEETGNALRTQARPEVRTAIEMFRYFGGLASETKGETLPLSHDMLSYTQREPLGVVAAVIPWNAPFMLATVKIAPGLCAGNTMVMKTAEDAPLAVLKLAEICEAHLPPGVLNMLAGTGPECGSPLLHHPHVAKLSFTGSTGVGKLVMEAAAKRILPVSLELGGKSPSIVFPDADEEWVVDGIVAAMRFTRQSQSCTAGSRLFLHRSIYDGFLEKLVAKASQLKIGDALDEASDVGAIINERQFKKVCGYVEDGQRQAGSRLVMGGLPDTDGPLAQGYFMRPTAFAQADNDWRLAREEIFGPVLVAIPWEDEDEVIRMANDSHYGLAAYIWTHDIGRALRAARDVEAGWVQINQGGGQLPGHSYGGYKQSGLGREFSLSAMLDSFTQTKNITVNLTR
ncbi:aldehyde dehydrogenase family protein [Methylobacterium aerolatum]|uniref:Betaine-aldehyde dehydrogenase n=1 Tax=Methylobacterium aerolatum TaxID=418708 RepID=A0ABU0I4N7_9HYPH|nr:aldehyde dehydrogenase family protein [Methylobacterium aerolatum]MDQ0449587.1 betaine-aldehyde dehydrogenase [Methylobacterium aerolatum]GJD36124.1 NAD/NADP-dependent betaine aldehyde dehydrogenase [Methylobacterium aerolatum]